MDEAAFWNSDAPSHECTRHDQSSARIYDLEERTAQFGERIILFAKKIPWSPVNNRLADQLVGAGTSVGANYCEADDGVSRGICRKEARESKFFLRVVAIAEPGLKSEAREIWREAHSLHLIFSRNWRSTSLNPK